MTPPLVPPVLALRGLCPAFPSSNNAGFFTLPHLIPIVSQSIQYGCNDEFGKIIRIPRENRWKDPGWCICGTFFA